MLEEKTTIYRCMICLALKHCKIVYQHENSKDENNNYGSVYIIYPLLPC